MQSYNLVENTLVSSNEEDVLQLKPKELFYLRVPSLNDMTEQLFQFIKTAVTKSSEVILSIPLEDYRNSELREKFLSLGIRGFSIRISHQVDKWLKHQGAGQFNAGDRDIITIYWECRGLMAREKELIFEFQVGTDTRILGPTITGLHEAGINWVVLNPLGEFTAHRAAQFRDVFEYIKIRGCNYLNIYFSPWDQAYREWNIKTQNTFSGLEYVHIDISNRCTHSCVFCGLYGPEAVEDMKIRSGGKLSKEISDYMKMEINSEKCFKIIESLPWSVRSIQFGGIGDPLMHENAVEFMSAARRRGFYVEMLSNMEYLDDDDIHQLHELGGPNLSELHFIANVSGGTAETYIKTRPRQSEKDFNKIVNTLMKFSELRQQNNGSGVHFTIMCVVNKNNCLDLLNVVKLAFKTGASRIWFKPMEVHSDIHKKQIPPDDMKKAMANSLREAIAYAEKLDMIIMQKDYCEEIIRQFSGETVNV